MRKEKFIFYTREWFSEVDKPKGWWSSWVDLRTIASKRRIRREVAKMKRVFKQPVLQESGKIYQFILSSGSREETVDVFKQPTGHDFLSGLRDIQDLAMKSTGLQEATLSTWEDQQTQMHRTSYGNRKIHIQTE